MGDAGQKPRIGTDLHGLRVPNPWAADSARRPNSLIFPGGGAGDFALNTIEITVTNVDASGELPEWAPAYE